MSKYIMAFDQGTTSSRCILFDKSGTIKGIAQTEINQIFPKTGWVEHDPMEIWSSQLSVATEIKARMNIDVSDIYTIGITNQRETTIVWNRNTGKPVYNAIVWQCKRTSNYCDYLKKEGFEETIKQKTGLIIDSYFSATKIKWILDNVGNAKEEAKKGNLLFGTVDTWILWKLTNGRVHATDYSNASRTMLFNIHSLEWDNEILEKLDIPISMMPEIKPSSYIYGHANIFGDKIPVSGIAGDQQSALFGQYCFEEGMIKNTYGTGCFILMNTGGKAVKSKNGLLTTIAWGIDNRIEYALEGSVFIAGAAIQWLRDGLRIIDNAESSEYYAKKVKDSNGVYVVPAFVGLGAPYWDPYARGIIVGLTRGIEKEHLIRATIESLAYQSYDVIKAMEMDSELKLKSMKVDGGASSNDFLLQFQSDILEIDVIRPKILESTALGVAYLAGLAVGIYKDKQDIRKNMNVDKIFKPNMPEDTRQNLIIGWNEAVKRSFSWINPDQG